MSAKSRRPGGQLFAWRAWDLALTEAGEWVLGSPHSGRLWPRPGPTFRMWCSTPSHRRPAPGCNCGFSVDTSLRRIEAYARLFDGWVVLTRVELLGQVRWVRGSQTGERVTRPVQRGGEMRAERVRILEPAGVDHVYAQPGVAEALTARYGITFAGAWPLGE